LLLTATGYQPVPSPGMPTLDELVATYVRQSARLLRISAASPASCSISSCARPVYLDRLWEPVRVGIWDGPTESHTTTAAKQILKDHRPARLWPTQWIPARLEEARER
jgi:hypothetical protein